MSSQGYIYLYLKRNLASAAKVLTKPSVVRQVHFGVAPREELDLIVRRRRIRLLPTQKETMRTLRTNIDPPIMIEGRGGRTVDPVSPSESDPPESSSPKEKDNQNSEILLRRDEGDPGKRRRRLCRGCILAPFDDSVRTD